MMTSSAPMMSLGICNARPKSLTVPIGMTPNLGRLGFSAIPLTTSFNVPSPPAAINTS
ncbi:Uncharacterised protein [Staphylococcus aureus]|nr:Uncharacterised protein [Staphylococcus aureus]